MLSDLRLLHFSFRLHRPRGHRAGEGPHRALGGREEDERTP